MVIGKKNLSQVLRVLTQITSGTEFDDKQPSYVPINDFVRKAIQQMFAWFLEGVSSSCVNNEVFYRCVLVANVPDAETHFHAHEFVDATVQPKPIYISPNEIYSIHSMLVQHQNHMVRL